MTEAEVEDFLDDLTESQFCDLVNRVADHGMLRDAVTHIYPMNRFNEIFSGYTPIEIAKACSSDRFDADDEYFYIRDGGRPISFTDSDSANYPIGELEYGAIVEFVLSRPETVDEYF